MEAARLAAAPFVIRQPHHRLASRCGGQQKPQPRANVENQCARHGLIVKYDGSTWRDEAGTDWNARSPFSLPDYDVCFPSMQTQPFRW